VAKGFMILAEETEEGFKEIEEVAGELETECLNGSQVNGYLAVACPERQAFNFLSREGKNERSLPL